MAEQASDLTLPAWCARMPTILSDIRFANARRRHAVNLGVGLARLDQPRIRHVLLAVDHACAKPELRFRGRDPIHGVMDVAVLGQDCSEADGDVHLIEHMPVTPSLTPYAFTAT